MIPVPMEAVSVNQQIKLTDIKKPAKDEWATGLDAMQAALKLEKTVNQALATRSTQGRRQTWRLQGELKYSGCTTIRN